MVGLSRNAALGIGQGLQRRLRQGVRPRAMARWSQVSEVEHGGVAHARAGAEDDTFPADPDGGVLEHRHATIPGSPVRVLFLHRPAVLNALTESMCSKIAERVKTLVAHGSGVDAVILRGSGPKAFCAGGDVRKVHSDGPAAAAAFFNQEYKMNLILGTIPPPKILISILDGITMGGGAGIAMHGPVRIATEKTRFAMPECAIGLHPDVGMSYFLPRLPGALGLYLGLTGARVQGIDNLRAGIATHFVHSSKIDNLVETLARADHAQEMIQVIEGVEPTWEVATARGRYGTFPDRDEIDKHFSLPSVADIFESLESEKSHSAFARGTLNALRANSPTSLLLTFESLRRGIDYNDLEESLLVDYKLTMNCLLPGRDFYEGVRSKLIDKDNSPRWCPANIDEVDRHVLLSYFT